MSNGDANFTPSHHYKFLLHYCVSEPQVQIWLEKLKWTFLKMILVIQL